MTSGGSPASGLFDGRSESADGSELARANGNVSRAVQMNGAALPTYLTHRIRLNPDCDHEPDDYDDLQLDYSPLIFSSLERYLPPDLLPQPRDVKVNYMREIILRYFPESEQIWLNKHREYRLKIQSNYQRLHRELYSVQAETFFVPSFLRAMKENTEQGFRNIMSEPCLGILTFEMLQPQFCKMMMAEVRNFERWVSETKFRIMKPNRLSKNGLVLDDFGLESMLQKLVEEFICPISKFFFADVAGATLDSHHGYVLEYGTGKGIDCGFHVDESEVTLNVCLGKKFSGGDLFFRGIRCENHVNTEVQNDEIYDYKQVPGFAVLHRGRHRHGARATTSGNRVNLLLWCRSAAFRELRKHQKDFSVWCTECQREKKEKQHKSAAETKLVLLHPGVA